MPLRLSFAARMTVGRLRRDVGGDREGGVAQLRRGAPPAAPSRTRAARRRWRSRRCRPSPASCAGAPAGPGAWPRRARRGRPRAGRRRRRRSPITMSALPARPMPPPRQKPLTAAITGTGQSYTAANAAKQPLLAPISAAKPSVFCISLMSTPALKPLPSLAQHDDARRRDPCRRSVIRSASSNQPATVERVDRRHVDDDLHDPALVPLTRDPHERQRSVLSFMTIEAVLWDYGGVFTASPFGVGQARTRGRSAPIPLRFGEVIFGSYDTDGDHPWHRCERGEITYRRHVGADQRRGGDGRLPVRSRQDVRRYER